MMARPQTRASRAMANVHRALDWWGHGLRLAVPARLRRRAFPAQPVVWLMLGGDSARAWTGTPGTPLALEGEGREAEAVLARHPDLARWLLLAPADVAQATVVLPQAAAGGLHEALRYEIDRQTPFSADEVAWDARLLAIDPSTRQLQCALVVAPLSRLAPLLARAEALGIALKGVDVTDGEGVPLGVNLLAPAQRQQPVNRWRRRNLLLAGLALGLVLMAAAVSLQRERLRAARLETLLQQQRGEAAEVAARDQRLRALVAAAQRIQSQRGRRAPLTSVLNALGERLPRSGHVERLSLEGTRLQLGGIAPQSTRLVPALQGSPLWRDVAMSGAVAADTGNAGDRYTLSMTLQPANAEPPR